MAVKAWDYLREFESEKQETMEAIQRVLESGWLILGDCVKQFEVEFAQFCETKYGIGVNSGTDALFLALKALDIGSGDEVITVPNTAVPTISAICATGALPRFVDIDLDTYLMDTVSLADAVSSRTKCIIPVHLYGQCVNMTEVREIAEKQDCFILEDCAQSHGATFNGRKAGSNSNLAAFSFYPTKVLGTYGDGGMIVTDDEDLADRLRRLRFYGMEKTYYSLEQGYNSRLDEIHAAILNVKLGHLESYILKRQRIAARYDQALAGTGLNLPAVPEENQHVYHLYVCRHIMRDQIREALKEREIGTAVHYPWPVHLMPAYQFLGYKKGDFPNAELAAEQVISLPMYPAMSDSEQDQVIEGLRDVMRSI